MSSICAVLYRFVQWYKNWPLKAQSEDDCSYCISDWATGSQKHVVFSTSSFFWPYHTNHHLVKLVSDKKHSETRILSGPICFDLGCIIRIQWLCAEYFYVARIINYRKYVMHVLGKNLYKCKHSQFSQKSWKRFSFPKPKQSFGNELISNWNQCPHLPDFQQETHPQAAFFIDYYCSDLRLCTHLKWVQNLLCDQAKSVGSRKYWL